MYIGRDSSCSEKDGSYNYFKSRVRFDKDGWNEDKTIEVDQMVGKVPLAEYWENRLNKLRLI